MKLSTFLLTAFLLLSVSMNAQHVTEEQALQKAQEFMNKKVTTAKGGRHNAPRKLRKLAKAARNDAYYIFNAEQNGGFVIVSGDERTDEILAYSTEGNIDLTAMPENMQAWLKGYEEQILAIPTKSQSTSSYVPLHPAIEPLITTKWSQRTPYNLQSPERDGQHCVTGCVATALAQIMNYHKWPLNMTSAIPAYTDTKGYDINELYPTIFEWNLMKDSYDQNYTDAEAQAVAKLMRYCGQAVKMKYGIGESSASIMAQPLINYFNYDKGIKEVSRKLDRLNDYDWDELIYNELAARHPVWFSGNPSSGVGHSFVCDGYDANGFYHFNWGWGGSSDGFFRLSSFNPDGKDDGKDNPYYFDQSVVVGIQPASKSDINNYSYVQAYLDVAPSDDDCWGFCATYWNYSYSYMMIDGAVGLLNDDGSVTVLASLMEKGLLEERESNITTDYRFFDGYYEHFDISGEQLPTIPNLPDDTYKLVPLWKEISDSQWHYTGEKSGDFSFYELTVNDNHRTIVKKEHNYEDDIRFTATIEPVSNMATDESVRLAIHCVNEGRDCYLNIYSFISNGDGSNRFRYGKTLLSMDEGVENTVFMSFNPWSEGTYHVQITKDPEGNDVVAEADMQVLAPIHLEMNGWYDINNNTTTVRVSNDNDTAYDNDIAVHIWQREQDESEAEEYRQHVYVGQHESKDIIIQCGERDRNKLYHGKILFCKNPNNNILSDSHSLLESTTHGSFETGGISYSIIDENNQVVMASNVGNDAPKKLNVPTTVVSPDNGSTYSVQGIDKFFCNDVNVEEVIVGEGITTIEGSAFVDCPQLCKITLPSTLSTIGAYMISNCPNLNVIYSKAGEAPLTVSNGVARNYQLNTDSQADYDKIKLYIPDGSWDSYQREWPRFKHAYVKDYSEIKGDVNGDGLVNSADVMTIYSIMAE